MHIQLTDIDPASVQASHGNIESLSLHAQPIGHWNGTIFKYYSSGWLGIPPHLQHATHMTFIHSRFWVKAVASRCHPVDTNAYKQQGQKHLAIWRDWMTPIMVVGMHRKYIVICDILLL